MIATAGVVFGYLACVNIIQIFGRERIMLGFTVVYIVGVFDQAFFTGNLSALYASRFIAGIIIGATTVLPSVCLTEICILP